MAHAGLVRVARRVQRVREGRVQTYTQHYYIRTQPLDLIERALLWESRRLERSLKSMIHPRSAEPETANSTPVHGFYILNNANVDMYPIVEITDDKRFERVRAHAVDYLTRIHQFTQRFPALTAQIVDTHSNATLMMLTLLGDLPAEFWAHYGATDAIDFYLRFEQRGKEMPTNRSHRKWVLPFLLNAVRPVPATPDTLERWRTPLAQNILRGTQPLTTHTIDRQIEKAKQLFVAIVNPIEPVFIRPNKGYSIWITDPSQHETPPLVLARYGKEENAFWLPHLKRVYELAMADVIDSIYRAFYESKPRPLELFIPMATSAEECYLFDARPFLAQEYRRRREANPELYQWAEYILFHTPYKR